MEGSWIETFETDENSKITTEILLFNHINS